MSNIPSADDMTFWKNRDGIRMTCPACDHQTHLGMSATLAQIKEAAVGHRFQHLMDSGKIGGGVER